MENGELKEVEKQKPLEILIVEDEPQIVSLEEDILEGHYVTIFNNAEQALDELRKRKEEGSSFDWVITDLRLPRMNGLELAEKIMDEKLGSPFVTMLTAMASSVEEYNSPEQLREKGVHSVMDKPFKRQQLLDLVSTARKFRMQ